MPKAAAQICPWGGAAGAGVIGRLNCKKPNRPDRPLAELIDGGEVAEERVATGDRALLRAAHALRLGVDVIIEVRRRHPVVAQVGERYVRLKRPVVRVRRAGQAGAGRRREVEGGAYEPSVAQIPRQRDRVEEGVGIDEPATYVRAPPQLPEPAGLLHVTKV